MNTSIEYRSYRISHDGSAFTAETQDGEPLQLRSKNMLRLTRAIDTLWNALEGKVIAPTWLFEETSSIDLDAASEAMLIVDRPARVPLFPLRPMAGMPARAAA
jgi:hypothetical protein